MTETNTDSERRGELLNELVALQRHWEAQDILTITGFMDIDEVAIHVERYKELLAEREAR